MTASDELPPTVTATDGGPGADPEAGLAPGAVVGRYRLVARLGQGGMGVVFRARDLDLEREVALKLLSPARRSVAARARLFDEARAMARLRHPNVVTVHDVGTVGGHDFIAMELVDGETLASWMRTPRPWRAIVTAFVAAGRGLAAAHGAGVVHRDIKPSNVLIGDDGRVAVADFGLARFDAVDGSFAGTPAYMAPEQLAAGLVDARADQFGLCAALHEALCGTRPFAGATVDALREAIAAGPPAIVRPGVPLRVRRAVRRGLAADPAARFRDMSALVAELERALTARRRGIVAGAAALGIGAAVTIAVVARASAPRASACAGERFTPTWPGEGGAARAAVASAFDGAAARSAVLRSLDGYADRWSTRWQEGCKREAADAPGFHAVAACLLDARGQAASLVRELGSPSDAVRERALAAIEALPEPVACDIAGGPRVDPALHDRVRAVEEELARALGLSRARPDLARTTLAELATDARALGHPPLVAKVLLALGELATRSSEVSAAWAAYEEAALAAEEAGDDDLRARARIGLAQLALEYTSDLDQVRRAVRLALAALDRGHPDLALRGTMLQLQARLAERDGDLAAALAFLDDADALYGDRIVARTAIRRDQARVLLVRGEPARALALVDAHRGALEEALGPDAYEIAEMWRLRALALHDLARWDEARAAARELARRWRSPEDDAGPHRVRGVVVDTTGAPVAGAEVVLTTRDLRGDGARLVQAGDPHWQGDRASRLVVAGAEGRFEATVEAGTWRALADAPAVGRGAAARVTVAGDVDVRIVLAPWSELAGRVTGDSAGAHVHVTPTDGADGYRLEVPIVEGAYRARIPAGRHLVHVVRSDTMSERALVTEVVEARAGEQVDLDLAIADGVALSVHVRPDRAFTLVGAGVVVVEAHGGALPVTARQMERAYRDAIARGAPAHLAATAPVADGGVAMFDAVTPGRYVVCAVAVAGDIRDPGVRDRVMTHADLLEGRCVRVVIAAEPDHHELTVEVPPPARLPAP